MKIRNVDKNWDWTFGKSNSNYTVDENSIILDIQMKIKEWQNDCFFALNHGIDWRTRLGSKNQKQKLDNDIFNVAKSVEGVVRISNFQSLVNDRSYRATFNVYTIYSTFPIPLQIDMTI